MRRKRVYKWVVMLWIAGLSVACNKEVGYDYTHRYNAGKQAFDDTENNLATFMSFFDLSLRPR